MPSEHEVFIEALSFTEPTQRTEYLDRVCGQDNVLRVRLNDLFKLHESVNSVLDRRPQEMMETLNEGQDTEESFPEPLMAWAAFKPYLDPPMQAEGLGRLGHYELLEVLGQGGYGTVFKAFDTRLNRFVAIKVLSPHLATTSPPRRRFLREARAAAAVRHENVIQIYAVEESPIPYLVMEFVAGETLQQRSDRLGPFDPHEVVRLGQQIIKGLAAAHERGLIHRDIKPCNILIADDIQPVAKLTDFGLARTADDASLSQSGVVIGTPMYMSPEQVAGGELDQRADLFSFGSVLYLMATGRPPFRASNTVAVLKRVAEDRPRSIRDVIPDTPKGLCTVISRLHSKNRDERYAKAQDVESALAMCLDTRPAGWWRQVGNFWSSGQRRWYATTAIVLMAVVAGALAFRPGASNGKTIAALPRISASEPTSATGGHPVAKTARPEEQPLIQSTAAAENTAPEVAPEVSAVSNPVTVPVAPELETVALSDWDKAVALMSPDDQVTTVRAKLKQLNPKLDDSACHFSVENGILSQLRIQPSLELADITPLRALRKLKRLRLIDGGESIRDLAPLEGIQIEFLEIVGHRVTDLSALKGMPLTYIGIWPFMGDDLTPLKGMKLTGCNLGGGQKLQDLSSLQGMPIEGACFNFTLVDDLQVLRGMPLRRLEIQNTKVQDLTPISNFSLEYLTLRGTPVMDLSPLKNMTSLAELTIDYDPARDKLVLESMPGLSTVNSRPVAEFLANP